MTVNVTVPPSLIFVTLGETEIIGAGHITVIGIELETVPAGFTAVNVATPVILGVKVTDPKDGVTDPTPLSMLAV